MFLKIVESYREIAIVYPKDISSFRNDIELRVDFKDNTYEKEPNFIIYAVKYFDDTMYCKSWNRE